MEHTLTIPLHLLQQAILRLTREPAQPVILSLGTCRSRRKIDWLARAILPAETRPPDGANLLVLSRTLELSQTPRLWPTQARILLSIGDGWLRGQWFGYVHHEAETHPLEAIRIMGSGMNRLLRLLPQDAAPNDAASRRWSRTMGALGGAESWQRLTGLPVAIVGCGRLGATLAGALARLGCRHLLLIDPDMVEPHNIGETPLLIPADVGRPKVHALAERLHANAEHPGMQIETSHSSITDLFAQRAARQCDLLICCADQDAARLVTAMVATSYHRLLLDIGTHLPPRQPAAPHLPAVTAGVDVRLILPGSGCLLCTGGLVNYADAVATLFHAPTAFVPPGHWNRQRAGSLASLNQLAAALGLRMLEDLVAERITRSLWGQISFTADGRMEVLYPSLNEDPGCLLCRRAGAGDEAFGSEPEGAPGK